MATFQHVRRAARLMAIFATLWTAVAAATFWMAPSADPGRHVGFAAVVMITPVLQLVLIGAAALRERSNPRIASFFYFGAVLLLVPGMVMMLA